MYEDAPPSRKRRMHMPPKLNLSRPCTQHIQPTHRKRASHTKKDVGDEHTGVPADTRRHRAYRKRRRCSLQEPPHDDTFELHPQVRARGEKMTGRKNRGQGYIVEALQE
jgi:hypothetical protein